MPAFFDLLREETDPAVRVVRSGAFCVRLHPSLYGRQWPDGEISDEHDDGVGRISLDGDTGRGAHCRYERAGEGEHRGRYSLVRGFPGRSR